MNKNQWEGVKLVRNKRGDVISKKIYNYKTGEFLKTEKVFFPSKISLMGQIRKISKKSKR